MTNTYPAALASDRDNARRACAAVRNDYRTTLTEISNVLGRPNKSAAEMCRAIDRIVQAARRRVDL
jgi:hypothetical protein